jgi:hypothetical protein
MQVSPYDVSRTGIAPRDVAPLVDRWVAQGIITAAQADRIRADLAWWAPRHGSMIAEGLGYLGGAIVLAGLGLVLGLSWDRLSPGWRVGIPTGLAISLLAAGAFVPARRLGPAAGRLRGVLWAGAVAALVGSLTLLGQEVLQWPDGAQVWLLAGAGGGVVSAVLWAISRHVLQHLTTMASVAVAASTGTMLATDSTVLSQLAVWAVGVVWFVLSLPDLIPRQGGGVLGALGAVGGGLAMLGERWGPLIALGTTVTLVVTAVARRQLTVLALASAGTLVALPLAVEQYLPGGMPAAVSLVVAGLVLLAVGVATARRRGRSPA